MSRPLVIEVPGVGDGFVDGLVDSLGAARASYETFQFRNGNVLARVDAVEPADLVILVAGDYGSHDGHLIELGMVADSLKRAWGPEIWCVLRYLPYSRGNRLTEPLTPLGARVFIDLLCALPIDRFATFNLHAPELLGFFDTPVIGLDVLPLMAKAACSEEYDYVVGTDRGRYDETSMLADVLGAQVDFCLKKRDDHSGGSRLIERQLGHLEDARILLFDDECEAGTTSLNAARQLDEVGAAVIDFAVTYDFYADQATYAKLGAVPAVRRMIRTNLSPLVEPTTALPVFDVDCSGLLAGLPRFAAFRGVPSEAAAP